VTFVFGCETINETYSSSEIGLFQFNSKKSRCGVPTWKRHESHSHFVPSNLVGNFIQKTRGLSVILFEYFIEGSQRKVE